jgi:hypothetical protein
MSILEELTVEIDESLLVDKQYTPSPVSQRKQTKVGSFSRVKNFSALDEGDQVLIFATQSDYDAVIERYPYIRLGSSWKGLIDGISEIPILVEIARINEFSDDKHECQIKIKNMGMTVSTYYKQVWRFIG